MITRRLIISLEMAGTDAQIKELEQSIADAVAPVLDQEMQEFCQQNNVEVKYSLIGESAMPTSKLPNLTDPATLIDWNQRLK